MNQSFFDYTWGATPTLDNHDLALLEMDEAETIAFHEGVHPIYTHLCAQLRAYCEGHPGTDMRAAVHACRALGEAVQGVLDEMNADA
jgi:hypothetical protein